MEPYHVVVGWLDIPKKPNRYRDIWKTGIDTEIGIWITEKSRLSIIKYRNFGSVRYFLLRELYEVHYFWVNLQPTRMILSWGPCLALSIVLLHWALLQVLNTSMALCYGRACCGVLKIKHKKLTSLQHRVRAMKSHIQNSTNHFSGIMW